MDGFDSIEEKTNYNGYYADVNGDGVVDGVIFADLAIGGSGEWNPGNNSWAASSHSGVYSYSAIPSSELKSYAILQDNYSGKFGDKPVLKAISSSGKDRFYVMALENIDSNEYVWYNAAYSNKMDDYTSTTSVNFGAGKTNTATMINKWNNKAYGEQNTNPYYKDMWGKITNNGWFVLSAKEWAAFGGNLGITQANYASLGLSEHYLSSSQFSLSSAQRSSWSAWCVGEANGFVGSIDVLFSSYVRLATTF